MWKQSMFQVLDIGRHCICVQIRVFKHIACWIKKYSSEILNDFFFSVYRIVHRKIFKKFGPTQCINSPRIAKRLNEMLMYRNASTLLFWMSNMFNPQRHFTWIFSKSWSSLVFKTYSSWWHSRKYDQNFNYCSWKIYMWNTTVFYS